MGNTRRFRYFGKWDGACAQIYTLWMRSFHHHPLDDDVFSDPKPDLPTFLLVKKKKIVLIIKKKNESGL